MTPEEARARIVRYWSSLADEALASARSELAAGRLSFAVNRAYYACFYAASAVLLQWGHSFKRHAAVRSAVHQYLVKRGHLSDQLGQVYDWLFSQRMTADYVAFAAFDAPVIEEAVVQAAHFVQEMRQLLGPQAEPGGP